MGSLPLWGRASTAPAAVSCCKVWDTEGCRIRQSFANSAWVRLAAGFVTAQRKTRSQHVTPNRSSSSNRFRCLSTARRSSGPMGRASSPTIVGAGKQLSQQHFAAAPGVDGDELVGHPVVCCQHGFAVA